MSQNIFTYLSANQISVEDLRTSIKVEVHDKLAQFQRLRSYPLSYFNDSILEQATMLIDCKNHIDGLVREYEHTLNS